MFTLKSNNMKKSFFSLLFIIVIARSAGAQSIDINPMANTPANQLENNGYYNSIQNNYYTEMYRSYWVWDVTAATWVKRVVLVTPAPAAVTPPQSTNTGAGYPATYYMAPANGITVKPVKKTGGQ